MKLFAIYFRANNQQKLNDGSIPTICINARGKKEEQDQAQVFSVDFAKFLRTTFLRISSLAASEDEHDKTKLLHMKSRLNKCYL